MFLRGTVYVCGDKALGSTSKKTQLKKFNMSLLHMKLLPMTAGSSPADFSTLKMEAIRSSETSVHTRSTRRQIPEDGILHSHRRENLKSYISLFRLKVRAVKNLQL
jgi:hypothetical protein